MSKYDKLVADAQIKEIQEHIKRIFEILEIEETPDNEKTPYRIAKMLVNEVFQNIHTPIKELVDQMTTFDTELETPVLVKDIPFSSMCSHHWMPFFGKVDVEYVPNGKVIGLSKIPRVVYFFSRMPQLQERFAHQIGEFLVYILNPKYLKVTVKDVTHTCVLVRGIESDCKVDSYYEYKGEQYL